jgi:hypothetical protein
MRKLRKIASAIVSMIRATPAWILLVLDWLVSVTERLVVLGVVGAVFYIGWLWHSGVVIASKPAATPATMATSAAEVLRAISENWKALLLLLIPLFYRTIREILNRIEKGPLGMELTPKIQIGRASCRERVYENV